MSGVTCRSQHNDAWTCLRQRRAVPRHRPRTVNGVRAAFTPEESGAFQLVNPPAATRLTAIASEAAKTGQNDSVARMLPGRPERNVWWPRAQPKDEVGGLPDLDRSQFDRVVTPRLYCGESFVPVVPSAGLPAIS